MAANSYKVLGQANPLTSNTEAILYTVPSGFMAFASILNVCNTGATTGTCRIAVRPAGITSTTKTFIVYDTSIQPYDSLLLTIGLSLAPTDIIGVFASTSSFAFTISGSEVVIDTTNVASVYNIATTSSVGMIRPDNTSIAVNNGVLSLIPGGSFTLATSSNFGAVRPDNTSILITSGVISANVSVDGTSVLVTSGLISANIANASAAGIVRPNGTSILVTSGVVSVNFNVAPYATSSTRGVVRISVSGTTVNIFTSD